MEYWRVGVLGLFGAGYGYRAERMGHGAERNGHGAEGVGQSAGNIAPSAEDKAYRV